MKTVFLLILLSLMGGVAKADSFETVVDGVSYTCRPNSQSVVGSSCSANGADPKPGCAGLVSPQPGCSINCTPGKIAKCRDAYTYAGANCTVQRADCDCY
jgi:hypothetical protein